MVADDFRCHIPCRSSLSPTAHGRGADFPGTGSHIDAANGELSYNGKPLAGLRYLSGRLARIFRKWNNDCVTTC